MKFFHLVLLALLISGCANKSAVILKPTQIENPPLPPLNLKPWSAIEPLNKDAAICLNQESSNNLAYNLTILQRRVEILEDYYYKGKRATKTKRKIEKL